jgi:peptidoglycan/LPS O-acetylase OafA/YrhL
LKQYRLLELDALRGLAALAVVFYHYFFRYNELYGHHALDVVWAYPGLYGVQLFFMISGFVIYWTLNRVEKPADFVVSRFSRLYPVYWAAILTTFCIVRYFGLPGREVSGRTALENIIMFQQYLNIRHVDGVYWTLTIELTFYWWIFVLYLFKQLKNVELWLSPLVLLAILKGVELINIPDFINNVFIIHYISFFVAGICFFKIQDGIASRPTYLVLLFTLLSTIATFSFREFLLFSAFYMVFYLAVSGRLAFLSFRPFVFLGTISYSLYLVHQNIGYVMINQFYKFQLMPLFSILLAISCSISIAYMLTRFIERPALQYIRKSYKNSHRIQQIAGRLTLFSKG